MVLSGGEWGSDDVAEWFPALTGRVSVATSQGLEWTGENAAQVAAEEELDACPRDDLGCVEAWLARYAPEPPAGLYVTGPASSAGTCCAALAEQVRASPRYRIVRDDDAALVALPAAAAPAAGPRTRAPSP